MYDVCYLISENFALCMESKAPCRSWNRGKTKVAGHNFEEVENMIAAFNIQKIHVEIASNADVFIIFIG